MPKLGPSEPTLATRPSIRRRRLGRLQVLRAGEFAIGALDTPLLSPACKTSRQQAGLSVGPDPTASPGSGPSPGTIVRGSGWYATCDGSGFGRPYKSLRPLALAPAGTPLFGWGIHRFAVPPFFAGVTTRLTDGAGGRFSKSGLRTALLWTLRRRAVRSVGRPCFSASPGTAHRRVLGKSCMRSGAKRSSQAKSRHRIGHVCGHRNSLAAFPNRRVGGASLSMFHRCGATPMSCD